jgi:hypothetical protein
MADTSRALSTEGQCDPGFLLALELNARKFHQDVLKCVKDYKARVFQTSSISPLEPISAVGREAFGSALGCLCIYKRLLAALSESDRVCLEIECQALASLILKSHEMPSVRWSWVYTGVEKGIALIVQRTRSSWEEHIPGQSRLEQRLASRQRWRTFCAYITEIAP